MFLLEVLFPKRCVDCGRVGRYVCPVCASRIHEIAQNEAICPVCERRAIGGKTHPGCRGRYTPDGLVSLFHYRGVVQKVVKAVKYRFAYDVMNEFFTLVPLTSHNLLMSIESHPDRMFIPIPLFFSKKRYRGFNQAEFVANGFSRIYGIPVEAGLLRRVRNTTAQVEMKNRGMRLQNMNDAFAVNGRKRAGIPQNTVLILVDDVFTTGATMRSAANVLKRGGFHTVWCMTLAR